MSLSIVIDMNLSPEWAPLLIQAGWNSIHWSTVGSPHARDDEIMAWARDHNHVVFTHDLDFGTTLALTHANGPSVIQVRSEMTLPEQIGEIVIKAITKYETELDQGAIVVVDAGRARVKILPIR